MVLRQSYRKAKIGHGSQKEGVMRKTAPIVVLSMIVFSGSSLGTCAVTASSPVHVSVGLFRRILPFESKTANREVRVVYEHHKDNRLLIAVCNGTVTASSQRGIVGKDKEGLSEELFHFDLPDGMYVCEVFLVREGGETFSDRTGEFPVMTLRRVKR